MSCVITLQTLPTNNIINGPPKVRFSGIMALCLDLSLEASVNRLSNNSVVPQVIDVLPMTINVQCPEVPYNVCITKIFPTIPSSSASSKKPTARNPGTSGKYDVSGGS